MLAEIEPSQHEQRKTVLVVEDNPQAAQLLAAIRKTEKLQTKL